MNVARRFHLGFDLAVLLALGSVGAGGYFLWIGPSLQAAQAKASATATCAAQEQQYRAARADYFRVRRTLGDLLGQVEREGGGMPPREAVDQRIAEMAAIARACDVVVEEVSPEDLPPLEEHLVTQVRFSARASYTAFRRFMRRVEQQMPFLDVTHFAVAAKSTPVHGPCRITWSARLYSALDDLGTEDSGDAGPGPDSSTGSWAR